MTISRQPALTGLRCERLKKQPSTCLSGGRYLIRPIRMVDPRFGNLRYLRDAGFWEGRAVFVPTGTDVEVLIAGHSSGPTDEQRIFFDELQGRYNSLWAELCKTLEIEARRVEIDAVKFVLVCVDVPPAGVDRSDGEWALSYRDGSAIMALYGSYEGMDANRRDRGVLNRAAPTSCTSRRSRRSKRHESRC